MPHTPDPKNPHPLGTSDYWRWHNKNHPSQTFTSHGPKADANRRRSFFNGKKPA